MNYDDLRLRLMIVSMDFGMCIGMLWFVMLDMINRLLMLFLIGVVFNTEVLIRIVRLVLNINWLLLMLMLRWFVLHKDGLLVMHLVVLIMVYINWLLFMHNRFLINQGLRLLLDYNPWLVKFRLNVLNLFIFMNFLLWLIAMMFIVIAWLTFLLYLSVLVFNISTMRLLMNTLILVVMVGIVIIIIVRVGA